MDEERAWLRGIMLDPDDDVRRLAYADWLDERGSPADEARAKLLRLQINEPDSLESYSLELITPWQREWAFGLPEFSPPTSVWWGRGFPTELTIRLDQLVPHWGYADALVPLEVLRLEVFDVSMSWLELPTWEHGFPLKSLTMQHDMPIGQYVPVMLRKFGTLPRLHSFSLHDRIFDSESFTDCQLDVCFPNLRLLNLSECELDDSAAEWLATSPWAEKLDTLDLRNNRISSTRLDWLRSRFGDRVILE
ncbi:MAG: TIGR02996 domain-containing protein [Fimbriiglobus sp.]